MVIFVKTNSSDYEQKMDMTKLGTHFRSLIAKQKETDSA